MTTDNELRALASAYAMEPGATDDNRVGCALLDALDRVQQLEAALRDAVDTALNVRDMGDRETYRGYLGELRKLAETGGRK